MAQQVAYKHHVGDSDQRKLRKIENIRISFHITTSIHICSMFSVNENTGKTFNFQERYSFILSCSADNLSNNITDYKNLNHIQQTRNLGNLSRLFHNFQMSLISYGTYNSWPYQRMLLQSCADTKRRNHTCMVLPWDTPSPSKLPLMKDNQNGLNVTYKNLIM